MTTQTPPAQLYKAITRIGYAPGKYLEPDSVFAVVGVGLSGSDIAELLQCGAIEPKSESAPVCFFVDGFFRVRGLPELPPAKQPVSLRLEGRFYSILVDEVQVDMEEGTLKRGQIIPVSNPCAAAALAAGIISELKEPVAAKVDSVWSTREIREHVRQIFRTVLANSFTVEDAKFLVTRITKVEAD